MTWLLLISNLTIVALGVTIVVQRIRLNREIEELQHRLEQWQFERNVWQLEVEQLLREVKVQSAAPRTTSAKGIL